jgi:cilia- and flagella-associated protein 57
MRDSRFPELLEITMQDGKELSRKVKVLYQKYISNPVVTKPLDEGIQKEYQRQRDYLEKTVQSLKHKLDKDAQLHRADNLRIMQENVALIKEINELRREIKLLKSTAARQGGMNRGSSPDSRDIQMQRNLIGKLREEIKVKEERIAQLEAQIVPRPMSRERLPPMEGFQDST